MILKFFKHEDRKVWGDKERSKFYLIKIQRLFIKGEGIDAFLEGFIMRVLQSLKYFFDFFHIFDLSFL